MLYSETCIATIPESELKGKRSKAVVNGVFLGGDRDAGCPLTLLETPLQSPQHGGKLRKNRPRGVRGS